MGNRNLCHSHSKKMEKLDLTLTMLGRCLKNGVEYGFLTSSGNDDWCKRDELYTIMGRVTRNGFL